MGLDLLRLSSLRRELSLIRVGSTVLKSAIGVSCGSFQWASRFLGGKDFVLVSSAGWTVEFIVLFLIEQVTDVFKALFLLTFNMDLEIKKNSMVIYPVFTALAFDPVLVVV